MAQAVARVLTLNGTASDSPTPVGIGVADLTAALHITIGVLAVAIGTQTGQGQRVDVNLLNSIMTLATQELKKDQAV